jgi:carboxyl-terminal processing protease
VRESGPAGPPCPPAHPVSVVTAPPILGPYHEGVRHPHLKSLARPLLAVLLLLLAPAALAYEELWESAAGRERIFSALVGVFRENYWDPDYRDWDAWATAYREQAVSASDRAAFDRALSRMVSELADDHSRWVGLSLPGSLPEQGARLPGLGFQHGFLRHSGVVVERVFAQTPAAGAGLQRGDLIVRINGQEVRDLAGAYEVDQVLREAVATGSVQFSVRRGGGFVTLELTPAPLDFAAVSELPQARMLDDVTGYLYIPSFRAEGTGRAVRDLLGELTQQGAQMLVLDLRGNLGGRLGELGLVLGAFVEGVWVEAVSRGEVIWRSSYALEGDQGRNVLETADGTPFAGDALETPVRFAGPLAVLVDRHNSSAGEIAPLVLQEWGRATVVGEATTGNVEAIQGFNLPDGSLVYVAVANLQGVSGRDYSAGVTPDTVVSSSLQELARGFDAPLAEALRALKSLPFTPGKFF